MRHDFQTEWDSVESAVEKHFSINSCQLIARDEIIFNLPKGQCTAGGCEMFSD